MTDFKDTRSLVVGYGSIGKRHTNVLKQLGSNVAVFSRRDVDYDILYHDIAEALKAHQPSYVVIANRTSEHEDTLSLLNELAYTGKILVEKPVQDSVESNQFIERAGVYVAYNLRFHPIIQRLHKILINEKILSIHVYAGQYLPDWRPDADYRKTYSAHADQGGGVIKDLSHELDYINWLCDGWQSLTANGGHFSHLEIDSDDVFTLLIRTKRCPAVTVQLNSVDRDAKREIIINTDNHSYKANLIKNTLTTDGLEERIQKGPGDTYRDQHIAILSGVGEEYLCSGNQGMEVVKMIEAALKANGETWINR